MRFVYFYIYFSGVISKTTIKTLWAIANRCTSIEQLESTTDRDMAIVRASESAVKVLAMAAAADASILSSTDNIQALSHIGFGDSTRARCDWSLAQQVCIALNCVPDVGFSSKRANTVKSTVKPLVEDIVGMISGTTWKKENCTDDTRNDEAQWYGAAQQGIHAIYHMSTRPEEPCEAIVKTLGKQLFGTVSYLKKKAKKQRNQLCKNQVQNT